MPALVDTAPKGGGEAVRLFESGAIMMYIAEKEGRFYPQETHKKYDVIQWVMWQMGNQGPKFGEQGHFFRASQNAANGDLAYAVTRFSDEVHRLYGVMNLGLHKKEWLAAGEYTIADMICYPWASGYKLRKIDLDEFPNVKRWMAAMEARPGGEEGDGSDAAAVGHRGSGDGLGRGEGAPRQAAESTSARRRFRRVGLKQAKGSHGRREVRP